MKSLCLFHDRQAQHTCTHTLLACCAPGALLGSGVVADGLLGIPNPWAHAFNPSRVLPGAITRVRVGGKHR